jgi:hypothetical protein
VSHVVNLRVSKLELPNDVAGIGCETAHNQEKDDARNETEDAEGLREGSAYVLDGCTRYDRISSASSPTYRMPREMVSATMSMPHCLQTLVKRLPSVRGYLPPAEVRIFDIGIAPSGHGIRWLFPIITQHPSLPFGDTLGSKVKLCAIDVGGSSAEISLICIRRFLEHVGDHAGGEPGAPARLGGHVRKL